MYFLFADEFNRDPAPETKKLGKKFFVYAGLIIKANKALDIHQKIEELRSTAKFPENSPLKFVKASCSKQVSQKEFNALKEGVLTILCKNECKIVASLVHHEIASTERFEFGINPLLKIFNDFLEKRDAHGMVFFDSLQMEGSKKFLTEKFTQGLIYKGQPNKKLKNLFCFSVTHELSSHFLSAVEISIGSLLWVLERPDSDVSKLFIPFLKKLKKNIYTYPLKKTIKEKYLTLQEDYDKCNKVLEKL